jgi:hypothetical protein
MELQVSQRYPMMGSDRIQKTSSTEDPTSAARKGFQDYHSKKKKSIPDLAGDPTNKEGFKDYQSERHSSSRMLTVQNNPRKGLLTSLKNKTNSGSAWR